MSKLSNTSFVKGTGILDTQLDSKFTDVETATLDINFHNVRSECIDIGQIGNVSLFVTDVSLAESGNSTTGIYTSAAAAAEISHGSGTRLTWVGGMPVVNGNLLRVHWQLEVREQTFNHAGVPLVDQSDLVDYSDAGGVCWLVWLQWNLDPALGAGNWEAVPGQNDHGVLGGALADGIITNQTTATTPIPLVAGIYIPDAGPPIRQELIYCEAGDNGHLSVRGSWNHLHVGPTTTVYGLRLVIRGLYHGAQDAANSYFENFDTELGDLATITFRRCMLGSTLMEGV